MAHYSELSAALRSESIGVGLFPCADPDYSIRKDEPFASQFLAIFFSISFLNMKTPFLGIFLYYPFLCLQKMLLLRNNCLFVLQKWWNTKSQIFVLESSKLFGFLFCVGWFVFGFWVFFVWRGFAVTVILIGF